MSHGQDTAAEAQRVASNNWVRDAVPARMWISPEHGAEMAAKIEAMTVAARPGQFLMPPRETWPAIDAMAKDFRAIVDERDAGRNKVARLQAQLDACGETIAKLQAENGELRNELGASASAAETTWLRDQIKRRNEPGIPARHVTELWSRVGELQGQNAEIAGQRDDIQAALSDLRESHKANLVIVAGLRLKLDASRAVVRDLHSQLCDKQPYAISTHPARKDPARAMDRAITATIAGWRPTI